MAGGVDMDVLEQLLQQMQGGGATPPPAGLPPSPMGMPSFPQQAGYNNAAFPSGGQLPDYGLGPMTPLSTLGLTPEGAGSISTQQRPQEYTQPIAEMVAPFTPIPGAGALAKAAMNPRVIGPAAGLGAFFGLGGNPGTAEAENDLGGTDRLKQLEQQKADFAKQYQDAITRREAARPKGRAPSAKQDPIFTQADNDVQSLLGQLNTLDDKIVEARKAGERQAGEERLRELQQETPAWQRLAHDYGPYAGYIPGLLMGHRMRGSMARGYREASAEAANAANRMVSGRGDIPSRVGGVNRFWQEGKASEVPFGVSPRARNGVRANANAPAATTLYPSPLGMSEYGRVRDLGVLGGVGAEVGVTSTMASQARDELAEARKAVAADPSEGNIQRMQAAETQAALWELGANVGRGVGLGYVGAAPFARYQTARPDVQRAEAERLRLNALMQQGSGLPQAPLGAPHHSHLQPRVGGRFSGPPRRP